MNRRTRPVLSALLAAILFFGSLPIVRAVQSDLAAASIFVSGECGAQWDNLIWTLDTDGTLTIRGNGEMMDCTNDQPWYNCRDQIKRIVILNGATTIGAYAFYGCRNITEAVIPNSVTEISARAFEECHGLTDLSLSECVAEIGEAAFNDCGQLAINVNTANLHYSSLDGVLFNKEKTVLVAYAKDRLQPEYDIPASVTAIGDYAFCCCAALHSIPTGRNVQTIGRYAFGCCDSLTDIVIPDGITTIDDVAFYNCSGLTSAAIPNSVTKIGDWIFEKCEALTDIKIDRLEGMLNPTDRFNLVSDVENAEITFTRSISILPIQAQRYTGASLTPKLTVRETGADGSVLKELIENTDYTVSYSNNIEIGTATAALTYIGDYASYSGSVNSVDFSIYSVSGECGAQGDNVLWTFDNGTLTISGTGEMRDFDGVRPPWYDDYANQIYRIHITEGVTSIGNQAFYQTWFLREIELPDTLTKIGAYAFGSCQRFGSINIPSSVREIDYGAFCGCNGLTSVQVPEGVERVGNGAFSGCIGLTQLELPASAVEIDGRGLCENNGVTYIHVDENNPNYSSKEGVLFNKDGTELLAYAKDKTEPNYTVPNGVEIIQQNAFQNCQGLKNVELPDGVRSIEWSAFAGCVELLRIEIPNSMQSIYNPFSGCDKLCDIVVDRAREVIEGDTEGAPNAKVTYLREMYAEVLAETAYTRREIKPPVKICERRKDGTASRVLEENKEYVMNYFENIDAGTARIVVRYVGEYTFLSNNVLLSFTITPKSCAELTITPIPNQAYTGREVTPEPIIIDNKIQ